jgi:hypothetical protein
MVLLELFLSSEVCSLGFSLLCQLAWLFSACYPSLTAKKHATIVQDELSKLKASTQADAATSSKITEELKSQLAAATASNCWPLMRDL